MFFVFVLFSPSFLSGCCFRDTNGALKRQSGTNSHNSSSPKIVLFLFFFFCPLPVCALVFVHNGNTVVNLQVTDQNIIQTGQDISPLLFPLQQGPSPSVANLVEVLLKPNGLREEANHSNQNTDCGSLVTVRNEDVSRCHWSLKSSLYGSD